MSTRLVSIFFVLSGLWATLLLTGCTGVIYPNDGGQDGGQEQKSFLIDSISLKGTTSEDCSVTVADVQDEDGLDDQAWQATFLLDDGSTPASLPADDGSRQQQTLMVKASRTSDGQLIYKKITLTLYEGS